MKNALNETSSVNFSVQEFANEITEKVKKYVSDGKVNFKLQVPFPGFSPFMMDSVCIPCDGYNEMVKMVFVNIYRINYEQFVENEDYFNDMGSYRKDSGSLLANLICIDENGKYLFNVFNSTLAHELEHAFQSQFGVKLGKFYKIALAAYQNTSFNRDVRNICYGVYYFSKAEIDANANALYDELKKNKIKSLEDAYRTDVYDGFKYAINSTSEALSRVSEDKSLLSSVEKLLNTKFDTIKKLLENNMKVCQTKFGKVISYYMYEQKLMENMVNETLSNPKIFDAINKKRKDIIDTF